MGIGLQPSEAIARRSGPRARWLLFVAISIWPVCELAAADFNGDGYDDLAVGAPGADVGSALKAGAVHVIYGGSGAGLSSEGSQIWTQDSQGITDSAENVDAFGTSLVSGDFNGDGYSDLGIGVPGEERASEDGGCNSGVVHVLYGSMDGLVATGSQKWSKSSPGIASIKRCGDRFGEVLAAGDFDGDGNDDLVIGVPDDEIANEPRAGSVHVLFGTDQGLASTGSQFWHQNTSGISNSPDEMDLFGQALAVGNFDGDAFDDLALGIPREDVAGSVDGGAVQLLYGSGSGLTTTGARFFHQDTDGVESFSEDWDFFGNALAAADFDGDGRDDLAISAVGESVGSDAGAVHVHYGSAAGLKIFLGDGSQWWHRNALDRNLRNTSFGFPLTAADFDGDGYAELAAGAYYDTVGGDWFAGVVNVIYGSGSGLTSVGNQRWHQGPLNGAVQQFDQFGKQLTVGDFDGDDRHDLAVGVPAEGVSGHDEAGAVNVIYGTGSGLSTAGNQIWTRGSPGIAGVVRTGDGFGHF